MNVLQIGRVLPGVALLCLLFACEAGHPVDSNAEAGYVAVDSTVYAYDPKGSEIPSQQLMIRKGEMNFKVNELQKTSQQIVAITNQLEGEVLNSHLSTEIQNTVTKKISTDSLLEIITHRQTNTFLIRVPSRKLDTLMNAMEKFSQLLHSKEVTAENVSLEYLSHELKAKNMAHVQEKHQRVVNGKKTNIEAYTDATLNTIRMQDEVIDHQIENMKMLDQVNYSTVKLSIYQDAEAYSHVIANLDADRFGPGFLTSIGLAIQEGWFFLLNTIIFLFKIWPLYCIVTLLFFIIRYVDQTFRPKSSVTLTKE